MGKYTNYRVVTKKVSKLDGEEMFLFAIAAVWYDEQDRILNWFYEQDPLGEDVAQLASELGLMVAALGEPVLIEVDGVLRPLEEYPHG